MLKKGAAACIASNGISWRVESLSAELQGASRNDGWVDGWRREFNVTFTQGRLNRQAGTIVMRQMALVARMNIPSNAAAQGIESKITG